MPTVLLGHAKADVEKKKGRRRRLGRRRVKRSNNPIIKPSTRKTSKPDRKGKGIAVSPEKKKSILKIVKVPERKSADSTLATKKGKIPDPKVPASEVQPPLPPLELVEDVVPLIVEEAHPRMLEEQSPTLTIDGLLGELAPEAEATVAHEKKDNEGNNVDNWDQIDDALDQQLEIQEKELTPIKVGDSMLKGDHGCHDPTFQSNFFCFYTHRRKTYYIFSYYLGQVRSPIDNSRDKHSITLFIFRDNLKLCPQVP